MMRAFILAVVALAAPAAAQVAPLTVALHADAPCPAPLAETPLLRLPAGCPSPWAGVLYSEGEHAGTRQRVARLDAAALAERDRGDIAHRALLECRAARDAVTAQCVEGVAYMRGALQALEAAQAPAEVRPSLWPWAALSGALTAAAGGAGAFAGRGAGEVVGYSVAGAAVGVGVALMVERWR